MKDTIVGLYESLKERLKNSLQEQQESELYIRLKERYDNLSRLGQRLVIAGVSIILLLLVLWIPLSSMMDATDLSANFEQRRQALKDLLKIQRDYSSVPAAPAPPPPYAQKGNLDQRILAKGVKIEQITESSDASGGGPANVDQHGIHYTIGHVTIRQALDISYDLEQADKSFKLSDFELAAEPTDPHYYTLKVKIINFAPKSSTVATSGR